MGIDNISGDFGISGRAVQPVSPVPHANHATEYPSSGQPRPPEKQPRKPVVIEDGKVVSDVGDAGVIYNAKGQIVPLDAPGLDVTG